MSGLSLSQTRTHIDQLGDLDEEITRQCHAARLCAKRAGQVDGASRVEAACKELEAKQSLVRKAKESLLEFDGYLHAQKTPIREALDHPRLGAKAASFFGEVGNRLGPAVASHVSNISQDVSTGLKVLASAIGTLEGDPSDLHLASCQQNLSSLAKVLSAAEKAVDKAVKMASGQPEHGYQLTAKVPDFIQQKIDERAKGGDKDDKEKDDSDKKASDHGYLLTADSQTPGNESKGPKEEGEEDEGWVPGHRTEDKKAYDYSLTN